MATADAFSRVELLIEDESAAPALHIASGDVQNGFCADMGNTTAETPVTSDPEHSVNGPCWNLNVRCQLFESLSPCCCHDVP